MQFFWVNLGTTHKEARAGNFLWAPLSSRTQSGKVQTRRHWDNVGKVKAGDLIFCYHDNYLRAIAKAEGDAYQAERPPTRSFNEWSNQGHRVDITLTDLKHLLRSDDIAPTYQAQFDARTEPSLFNNKGSVNQIYMAQLPADAALYLLEQAEVVADYEDQLVDSGSPGKSPSVTTREALVKARVGQGAFRTELLKRWEKKCALTGLKNPNLLVASHIQAWALADNKARLDTDNGLLLATHIDRLFDCGLISFGEDGQLLISDDLTAEEHKILGLDQYTSIPSLSEGNRRYLEKHRKRFSFA
ncbi:HNH endonuclease [Pseudomonas donghuensis]|uniref:HNH endonuclease n=1 Tax=Pseudomonas donghuensis TaxID=1163398 RepID=UPI00215ECC6C|nr:HNH endonuclease signature motif containing protein [Pseudomonas donghuensis]UVL27743.1 HNH endonuclease [Pseudomonas donghuensis]